jgi:hypothetical protein
MATIPTLTDFTAQEKVLASKLNANTTQALRFLLDPPKCVIYPTTPTTLTTSNFTDIAFGAEVVDNDGMHSNTTNNTRITITTPGLYLCVGQANFGLVSAGTARILQIKKNDTTAIGYQLNGNVALTNTFSVVTIAPLVAGDWITLQGYQNSGANLSTTGGVGVTQLAAHWLSV